MNPTRKKILWMSGTISLVLLIVVALQYTRILEPGLVPGIPQIVENTASSNEEEKPSEVPLELEEVATGLEVPWSLAFTSPERMLVTTRPGSVYAVIGGRLREAPLLELPEVDSRGEEGLMGLTLDPDYPENKYVYVSLAYPKAGNLVLKVVRYRDLETRLAEPLVLIDDIPAAEYHAGSRLKFGPDGKLYVTTGDATDRNLAQKRDSLAGKILRMNADGSVPDDNPFPGSLVFSLGHRNPQGIDWHPVTGELYATEHGPSLFDGPAGGDEVNRIVAAANYGWPLVSHEKRRAGTEAPLLLFTPAVAPASGAFYTGEELPQFKNQFFFGGLKGEGLFRVKFSPNNPDTVLEYEKLKEVNVGRVREVVAGPDGALYFTSSNRDGRGKAEAGDDKIYRLRAQ